MNNVKEKNHGKIVQVMGPVVDVEFENNDLPFIKDALEVYSEGKRLVMEVAQHIGNNTVRCIMLGASEGLCQDMDVIATGKGALAEKILDGAKKEDIPVYHDQSLAKTLSKLELGEMIPPELYEVIAEVLVFVDRMDHLKEKMAGGKRG